MGERCSASELLLRSAMAGVLALVSGSILLYISALCAAFGPPHPLRGAERWLGILGRMFLSYDPGLAAWPLAGLLITGAYFCVRNLALIWNRNKSNAND